MNPEQHPSNPQSPQQPSPPLQPAGYDLHGRPLYYHPYPPVQSPQPTQPAPSQTAPQPAQPQSTDPQPPTHLRQSHITTRPTHIEGENFNPQIRTQYANEPDAFHTTRLIETKKFEISDDLKRRHELSKERYPYLNLSEGEFVILDIKRHPIGMLLPMGATLLLLVTIFAFGSYYPAMYTSGGGLMPEPSVMFMIILLVSAASVLGGALVLWVYLQNQFFMTNESVIQEKQQSLFARKEQTVSLGSIEDASFHQAGILPTIFNYGTIRLSTEGEDTTYIFHFVENPKKQVAILNNAIEAFKNGRPVDPHDN